MARGRRRTGGRRVVGLLGTALLKRSRWSGSAGLGPRARVGVRPLSRSRLASADLFGQGGDAARGAAAAKTSLYCATSPRSSAPWTRRRATVSWMSSTANMRRCRPSVLGGGFSGSARAAAGVWYLVSSSLPWPSGVRIIAISLRKCRRVAMVRSAQRPSICPLPSSSMPRRLVKNATAASRSSTTMAAQPVDPLNGHVSEHRMVMSPSI